MKVALVAVGILVGATAIPLGPAAAESDTSQAPKAGGNATPSAPDLLGLGDVFVTNDSAHPVPTMATGTTPISGSVTVANPNPLPVSGSVTITNQNPVVTADPELAREPTRIPLGFYGDYQHIYDIPAGKRLVVEFISAWDSDVAVPLWDLTVVDAGSGHGRVRYQFVGEPVPYCPTSCYALNQAIHFYADEGDRLIRGAGGVGTEDLPLNITGYLIDRP